MDQYAHSDPVCDDDTDSKLKGFGSGADNYLTKPLHREELVARIHAIIRRSKGHAQSVIFTGTIAVNLDAKTVEVEGKSVHLTGKEYQILELLSLRKKLSVATGGDNHIETVWGRGYVLRDPVVAANHDSVAMTA